jgi:Secretion system C-terminal sorting domain
MNKTCFAFLFLLFVFGELSAQQSEKLIAGNTNTIALSVDSLQAGSSTPSSSCYGADLIQTRKRVPVDTSQRLANPKNGEPQQLKKRVPVDTSQRLANPTNGEPQQLKKRVPVDTSQRLANPTNGEPQQLKKRVPVDTSQRLANPINGEPQQLKKRVPVDTSQRLTNPTNEEPQQLKKRVPVDTSQRVGTFEHEVAVFPNPASGTLYLRQLPEQTTVRLYSSSGLLIREERATGNSLDLDLSALPEGVYILQLTELNHVLRIVHTF